MFPDVFTSPPNADVGALNAKYGGWNPNVKNLFFANGQRDPWRDATVSSDFHTRISTSSQPIAVSDGFHCSDLSTAASVVDPTILTVQQEALSKIKEWLSAWTPPSTYREVKRDEPVSSQSGSGIVKPLNSWLRKGVQII